MALSSLTRHPDSSANRRDAQLHDAIVPPPTVDGFELTSTRCGATIMLLRTFSTTPQVFEMLAPEDSSASAFRPVPAEARIAAFPGFGGGTRSAIAVFGFDTAAYTRWRNAAMSVSLCPR